MALTVTGTGPYALTTAMIDRIDGIGIAVREEAKAQLANAGLIVGDMPQLASDPGTLARITDVPDKPSHLGDVGLDQLLQRVNGVGDALKGVIQAKTTEYFNTIFPLDDNLRGAQAWLGRVLAGQGALDPVYEERLLERDRARIRRETAKVADEAMSTWAARGYALPPGGAVGAVLAVQRTGLEQVALASNNAALKVYETEIGLMKDAIDMTLRMRVESISRMAEYINTAAIEPLLQNKVSESAMDVQNKLIAAASEFFKLEAAYTSYPFDKDREFLAFGREFNKMKFDTEAVRVTQRVQLALQSAQMAATQAAAALNGLHAQVGVSGSSSDATTTQLFA